MKKGFTLLELMVALGIFSTVAVIAVAAFSLIINLKIMSGNIRELNQKVRYSLEIITRLARQAQRVELSDCNVSKTQCKKVTMYFAMDKPTKAFAQEFNLQDGLKTRECLDAPASLATSQTCSASNWSSEIDLLQGAIDINDSISYLTITGALVPTLDVYIAGAITNSSDTDNPYLNNDFSLNSVTVLESLK